MGHEHCIVQHVPDRDAIAQQDGAVIRAIVCNLRCRMVAEILHGPDVPRIRVDAHRYTVRFELRLFDAAHHQREPERRDELREASRFNIERYAEYSMAVLFDVLFGGVPFLRLVNQRVIEPVVVVGVEVALGKSPGLVDVKGTQVVSLDNRIFLVATRALYQQTTDVVK